MKGKGTGTLCLTWVNIVCNIWIKIRKKQGGGENAENNTIDNK